jgi:hypothetical protein
MIKPITLTDVEIEKMLSKPNTVFSNWDRNWSNDYGYDDWANPPSSKRTKHEWIKDIYFTSREFITCKNCGAKKEKTIGDYCEEATKF